jgi:RNA polymerase sigma-70 factor (ECF subfamily)
MKFLQKNKEKNILRRIKKGDEQAFIWLYDQYAPKIYRFIYLKTNSPQDSEDLTSEVFFRLWRSLGRTVPEGQSSEDCPSGTVLQNPRALLYQIARNLVIDYYRRKPKKELIIDEEKEKVLENIPSQDDLRQKMALESDLVHIRKALTQIKEEYQEIIIWHYLDDFSIKEIAQILEKPEVTIRVQLHRALKALRRTVPQGQSSEDCP